MPNVADTLTALTPYKYYLVAAILIIIIVLYFWFFTGKEEATDKKKDKSKKSKKSKKGKAAKNKSVRKLCVDDDDEEEESDDEDGAAADAKQIYRLVHENMVNGMTKDQFMQVVGDLGDAVTYIHLKQLYTDAADQGLDPNNITVADYVKALKE